MLMKELEEVFEAALDSECNYVGVHIYMEGFSAPEVIINTYDNFVQKLEYYKAAYDENCDHKFAKGIRIINATTGDSFREIERNLL